jgi:6-phosphogluconate dehydrogenase (decarboxylating)
VKIGLLHPGEMGATVGAALAAAGHEVLWASEGRSAETRERATAFTDAGAASEVVAQSEVVFSVVPPHAALELARSLPPFDGIYVDANAIAPSTAREIEATKSRFVDGGIIGGPPGPRLYLSGDDAATVAALFGGSPIEATVVADASALKAAYASWTKAGGTLLRAIHEYATRTGVWEALAAEWPPELHERLAASQRSAERKGWRWIGEMEEAARAFADAGLPPGFHEAAAEIFRAGASGSRGRADSP